MSSLVSSMLNAKKWIETMMRHILPTFAAALVIASPLAAQLQVPGTGVGIPPVGDVVGDVKGTLDDTVASVDATTSRTARRLLRVRDRTLSRLLRQNRDVIERDINGDLARRGELLAMDIAEPVRLRLVQAGFAVIARDQIEELDLSIYRLAVPEGMALAKAQALALTLAPEAEISADHLHFQAGSSSFPAAAAAPAGMQISSRTNVAVGVIDGAPGPAVPVHAKAGFARGAPLASNHGSAIASLLRKTGVNRVLVADVYGNDPAGGNSRAIAKALGWLTANGSRVITISLVGPKNSVVARAIAATRSRGVAVVAAVGNDGPAAAPAYPASYPGVVAVTGVDRRSRALIEAGRALNLDYAGPGAGVYALDARGRTKNWRGTSYATPLVAARIASAIGRGGNWRAKVDAEARDLGKRGPDSTYGRGLVCAPCGKK